MMRLRFFLFPGLVLAMLALGCSALGVAPQFRYKVTERFKARPGAIDVTGVRVNSALPDGRLSDAELEKLGSFLSEGLRRTTIGVVVNLNGRAQDNVEEVEEDEEDAADGRDDGVAYVVTVDVTMFKAATEDERRNRIHSQLRGNISMRGVTPDRSLGSAIIWARGSGLDLDANYASDTIREFFVAMRQVIR